MSDGYCRNLQEWLPNLERLIKKLNSSSGTIRQSALDELAVMDDADCLAAFECLLPTVSEDVAVMFLSKISQFRSQETCLTVARIALNTPRPKIRAVAIRELRKYHSDHYVPELLQLLTVPLTASSAFVNLPNGNLALQRFVLRELRDRKELHRYTKYVNSAEVRSFNVTMNFSVVAKRLALNANSRFDPSLKMQGLMTGADILVDDMAAQKLLAGQKQILDAQLASINAATERNNHRIIQLLEATQGVSPGVTPNAWWHWWNQENERTPGRKPLVGFQRYDDPFTSSVAAYSAAEVVGKVLQMSCLVKGTLVQTSKGLMAVDQIQVGDLVMAQDVNTSELSLKPVLETTVRPPTTTIRIVLEDEVVQATAGHPWWVSGKGWLRTKELEAGMMLHTARGNTKVLGIEPVEKEVETYNLVVADSHTYFVGQNRLLSYDNTPVKATLHTVPGYGLLAAD